MLIFGLGNLPYPKSRHRYVTHRNVLTMLMQLDSVGQLIVDGLAAKFGARLAYEPKLQSFHGSVGGLEMPGSPNNKRLKLSFAKTSECLSYRAVPI